MDDLLTARVKEGFDKQGFMHTLGAELSHVAEGKCSIRLAYSEALTQQHGLFHGGVTSTLADNAAGFAAYTLMSGDEQPLTVEFKISFLEPGLGDALEARARVLRSGRRLKHVQVDVYALDADGEKQVAAALATVAASKVVVSWG
ncbi:MAG: PaaI family thioesterase [Thiolinea sp.]